MFSGPDDLAVLALAVLLDLALGEPPARLHPTVWMGFMVEFLESRAPKESFAAITAGLLITLSLVCFWGSLDTDYPRRVHVAGMDPRNFEFRDLISSFS